MSEDIKIAITSSADTAGLDKANAQLDKTAKAGTAAKAGAVGASAGFSAASAAAGAASGNIQGVAAALGQLAPKLQALSAALPVIGLLMAAFTAWKKAIEALNASQEAQAAGLRAITAGNIAAGIDTVAASYGRLQQAIDEASASQADMIEGQKAITAASRDAELADIELGKQKALAGEADPLRRKQIEADAAVRANQVNAAFGSNDEALTASALANRRDTAAASRDAARTQEEVLTRRLAAAIGELGSVSATQKQAIDSAWTSLGKDKAGARYDREIGDLTAAVKKLGDDVKAARNDRVGAEAELSRADAAVAANAIAAGARSTGRAATAVAATADAGSAAEAIAEREARRTRDAEALATKEADLAAKQAEARRLQDSLDGATERDRRERGEAQAAAGALSAAEAANAGRGRQYRDRAVGPYREAAGREEAEARAAASALAGAKSELGGLLAALVSDIKSLEAEVKRQRSRLANARVDAEAGA